MDSSIFCDTSAGTVNAPDMLNTGDNYNPGDNRLAKVVMPVQKRKLKKSTDEDEESISIDDLTFVKKFKPADCEKVFDTLTKDEQEITFHPADTDSFKTEFRLGFKDGKRPVAFILGNPLKDKVYITLAVDPEYRKMGLATDLMEKMIDAVEDSEYTEICYRVHKDNKPSAKIIKKAGGKEIGDDHPDFKKYSIKF